MHAGNRFRKFCYESAAQKKYVDNKRKREQRSAAKRTEQEEEAFRIAPMRPLTSFFARRNYDETATSPLPGAAEVLESSLLDVNEELDIALCDIQ